MAGGRAYEMAFRLNAKLGKSYNNAFARAESVAKKAFGNIAKMGAAIVGGMGIVDMANTYKDFQQSIANTGAIAGVSKTSKEFKALENAALEAGKKTTKTAKEAADALGYMSLAGWDTNQSISGLMPILRLSEATGADLAMTSDLVTDSMSAMGLSVDELSKYLDVAAQANNKSNQTATQLMEAYIGVGGKFKGLNTPLKESAAVLGVLANRGIKGSEAGNSLTSVLTNLTKKSGESYKAMKALGISAYDSSGNFKGITKVIAEVSEKLKSLKTNTERDLYIQMIGGKTQETAFRALLSGYETFTDKGKRELIELQEEMENSSGALEEMADKMNDTLGGALAILGSASDDVKIQIMRELEPTITPIIRSIADALPGLGAKVAGFVKTLVKKGKEIWNGLKPVFEWIVSNFDKIKIGIAAVGGAFVTAKIAEKVKSVTTAVKGLTKTMNANPYLRLVGVLIGVGFAVYDIYKQVKKSNLARHFGNITLSAEEMERVVEHITSGKKFEKLAAALNIKKKLKESESTLKEYVDTMERMEFKLEIGLKPEADESALYKETAENYIKGIGEYLEEAWRSDLMLFEGDETVQTALNSYYSKSQEMYKKLGEDLSSAVTKAFEDGIITFDETKVIAEKRAKLAEFHAKMTREDSKAEMEVFLNSLDLSSLTPESYDEVIEQTKEKLAEINKNVNEGTREQIAALNLMQSEGILSEHQVKVKKDEISANVSKTMSGIYGQVLEAFNNANYSAYGDDIDALYGDIENWFANIPEPDKDFFSLSNLSAFFDTSFSDVPTPTINNIADIYEKLEPILEASDKFYESTEMDTEEFKKLRKERGRLDKMGASTAPPLSEKMHEEYDKYNARRMINVGKKQETQEKINSEWQKRPYDANLTIKTKTNVDKQTLSDSANTVKGEIKNEINTLESKPWNTDLIVEAKTNLNQGVFNTSIENNKKEATGKVSKIGANPYNTNLTVNAKANLDEQALESSANAAKRQAEKKVSAIFDKFTVNGKLNVGLAVSSTVSSAMEMLSSIGKPKGFAKGTEYTPDTFIAGEKGAELITGAKGRKVFTALETGNIFSNIGRIKDTLISSVSAVNIFDRLRENASEIFGENETMAPERIVKPSNTMNNNSNVSITINNEIKIDGDNNKNTANIKDLINKAMIESGEELAEMIIDIINQNNERKVRLSNE